MLSFGVPTFELLSDYLANLSGPVVLRPTGNLGELLGCRHDLFLSSFLEAVHKGALFATLLESDPSLDSNSELNLVKLRQLKRGLPGNSFRIFYPGRRGALPPSFTALFFERPFSADLAIPPLYGALDSSRVPFVLPQNPAMHPFLGHFFQGQKKGGRGSDRKSFVWSFCTDRDESFPERGNDRLLGYPLKEID